MKGSKPGTGAVLALTPRGTLRFFDRHAPWQEELFCLAAEKKPIDDAAARFWARLAELCIRELCYAANPDSPSPDEGNDLPRIPLPAEAQQLLDAAPPMAGGEYLNFDAFSNIWHELLIWCRVEVHQHGGLTPFLAARAPKWTQIGRVFFHLADNKLNTERPFVFMATYATGLNEKGQLRHAALAHAVQYYGRLKDTTSLKRLLTPVQKAAAHIPWVNTMLETKALFAPRAWLPAQAYAFLTSAETLQQDGIGVRLPDWWKKRPRPQVNVSVSFDKKSSLTGAALVSFDIRYSLGDEDISARELEELLASANKGLTLFKGQWIEVDADKLRQAVSYWEDISALAQDGTITYSQGMRLLAGLQGPGKGLSEGEEETIATWSLVSAGNGFRELLRATRGEMPLEEEPIPGLRAELRPYQQYGVSWMRLLARLGIGACLADDMGLGKTIQVIALLLGEREREKKLPPSLLVLPASLLSNWKNELERFAPSLSFRILHPSEEPLPKGKKDFNMKDTDLVLTTYGLVARLEWLKEIPWRRVVLDEAQAIKNPGTKQSRSVRALKGQSRLALTGTPIENSLMDLWTLFDFLNPGLLGSAKSFAEDIGQLKKKNGSLAPLRRVTSPYILRRLKTDKSIISSLPDKVETTLYACLTREQAEAYQQVTNKIAQIVNNNGFDQDGSRALKMMQYILVLKQLCNHPDQAGFVAKNGIKFDPRRSGKFRSVGELCQEISSRQEKVLVFTQFREVIEPLSNYLADIFGRPGLILHGQVPVKKRGELVRTFQDADGPPFFIISLKAGGTGLTLTEASHVIHFDRWWNPAVEDQATDRAFRIGQKKNVMVHKCITRGTVEENIDTIMQEKRGIADEVLDGGENLVARLSDEEFLKLIRLDLHRSLED